MARAQLLYESKKSFRYGSVEESVVLHLINRMRTAQLLQTMVLAASPENVDKLLREYKGILFPEDRFDELKRLKKMQDSMKAMRGMTIEVMPLRKGKR